jgi:S-formylglutathione hydrolase FrmB
MRRGLVPAAACALGLALPAPVLAARVETWTTDSRFVDPAKEQFNPPPPGASPRPNALRVNVYLPDGYDGRRRFPVLYLLHGHGDAYDYWASPERGDVSRVARELGAVIVMPEGARGWYVNWWRGGRRGDPGWERYHLDELIPLVERRLRVRRGRRWHAVAGLSMGGEGSLFYASQRPGYFGAAASFSGSISIQRPEWPQGFDTQGERHLEVFGDPEEQRFYWSGHNPVALAGNLRHTRLFVAVGDGVPGSAGEADNYFGALAELELAQHAQDFVKAARAAGAEVTHRPQQGIHDWPYWRRHLAQAIDWGFFEPVAEEPASWSYQTVAQSGAMWGLQFDFAAPPETVETFDRRGSTLGGDGSGTATVETAEGCRFTATMPFSRELPSGCRIRLAVRPRRARPGRRTRFRFRTTIVRDGSRLPLRRALIRLAGRRVRTDRRGRASLTVRFRRPGRRRARASRRGFIAATVAVRVR